MKKISKGLYIVVAIIIILSLMFRAKWEKDGMLKIGNMILVMKDYNQQKNLKVEERLAFESEVKKYDDMIRDFKPGTGTKEIDLGNGIKGIAKVERKPESTRFIQKANNLKAIGRYNDAIRTLMSMNRWFTPDVQSWNEFGSLYEEIQEYDLAIEYYQKIMDTSKEYRMQAIEKIITLYIAKGDGDAAGKLYVQYITKEGGTKNPEIEKQIQQLNFSK